MADDPEPERDPAAVADAAAAFRDDADDGEAILETLLEVDAEHETWTFDDLPLDSGTFGELVSRDLVAKTDGEYRVASREGVRAALEGREIADSNEDEDESLSVSFSSPVAFDPRAAGALAGALVFLVAMRLLNVRSVFREGRVVSPGNDPYYYRYWMDQLLAESNGLTDWSILTEMPAGAVGRRPLTHAANWWFAELLGGDQWAADMVAAWLPVVATLALGVLVYWLAVVVTDDVRVGVASVVLLALAPVHAVYSGVGFLEHRLHQYFWLGVTLLALAWLAVDVQRRRDRLEPRAAAREHLACPWAWVAALALGVALPLSAFAWGGSILLFVPAAGYVALKVAIDARDGLSPGLTNAPIVAGLVVSALLSAFLHFRWGWHESFTGILPAVVAVGALAVVGLGEAWRRVDWPIGGLVGLEAVLAAIGLLAFRRLRPEDWTRLWERADALFFREAHGATETGSLFATKNSVVLEPLAQLGLNFYIALAVLGWACWIAYRRYEPGWLLLSIYTVFWLVLAAFQVRFAAQLAIPLSVLGGLGLVYLLAWIDLARVPRRFRESDEAEPRGLGAGRRDAAADGGEPEPSVVVPRDWRQLATLAWVALLICGLSLLFVPSLSAQTAYSDAEVAAVDAIDEHATQVDREYPDTFVLSQWGDNRMYNYFVNGESESYGYAANTYDEFLAAEEPDSWYDRFDGRVGYVVITGDREEIPAGTAMNQLHGELGAGSNGTDPLEHYQALYVGDETTAFAVVPGATVTAELEPEETVTVATEREVSGETIVYEREVTAGEDGTLSVTVPYSGEYSVGGESLEVPEEAVENGETVTVE
ncbi:dolichyl-diphosphooligosaccharide--protein glycosyltransferase [Halobiforma haloterrestris]|uniref:dolichyl-phosphooligosaccharide-protein glycotransferase n=1 Tax=Natronobacterium haloterrestre TaxID=148448 RepID=A0A1I1LHG1_NATHA|nr:MFS transporter [Halobiforma haloterrestris]SFC72441.1 dolichyl-diphosphooligosaccharide--protein glycosyltransferase [Halobiforma haloterrestris]